MKEFVFMEQSDIRAYMEFLELHIGAMIKKHGGVEFSTADGRKPWITPGGETNIKAAMYDAIHYIISCAHFEIFPRAVVLPDKIMFV